jgi:hypothetical protein
VISQSGDDPQEDLAKFGYNLNMIKKKSFKKLSPPKFFSIVVLSLLPL